MKHFSERLKAARKMNGFSLQDLSDAIQNELTKQDLSRLENGESIPDSKTISLLSKALKVTGDHFFRESAVSLGDLSFRKRKKLSVKEQDKVTAQTIDFLERYVELEEVLGVKQKLKFVPKQCKVKSAEDIEQVAEALRKKWHLGDDPLPNIIEMLEENNIKVFTVEVDKAFSGMSTFLDEEIAVIVLNTNKEIPLVRQRFTALHELAHLYLDLSGLDEKECEKRCDRFASAMLLPQNKIREYLGNKRTQILTKELWMIAEQYGISMSAVMYRAFTLNIITASYHKFFMIKYNQFNTKAQEFKVYTRKEQSERFLQLLLRAVAEEIISTTKAAALNNQKLGEFREYLDNVAK